MHSYLDDTDHIQGDEAIGGKSLLFINHVFHTHMEEILVWDNLSLITLFEILYAMCPRVTQTKNACPLRTNLAHPRNERNLVERHKEITKPLQKYPRLPNFMRPDLRT